jgi:L-lactate permease
MTWLQNYNPLGFFPASILLAVLPILFFVVTLIVLRWRIQAASAGTLLLSLVLAVTVYEMPLFSALAAAIYGFCYGLWPIAGIIFSVVFLYRLTIKSGQFGVIRASIASITPDARLQLILIGFAFSAFLEGAAGYGAPVAITAALLVGLGFDPIRAAMLCLVANTAPVAFGAMGTSITVASQVSQVELTALTRVAGIQLPLFSLLTLLWIIVTLSGWRGAFAILPALLVAGASFAGTMMATAFWIGPQLPAITSSIACMLALTIFLRYWQPAQVMRLREHAPIYPKMIDAPKLNFGTVLYAWLPFILLTAAVVLWGSKTFQSLFGETGIFADAVLLIEVPFLHGVIYKTAPIVGENTLYPAIYHLDLLSAMGAGIFAAALLSAICLRLPLRSVAEVFVGTFHGLKWTILSIGLILGFATLSNYSGMSATLALFLAQSGSVYPLLAPLLGWFGVFLTGSDTSSNALFAPLQAMVADQIGVSDALLVAGNSLGGAAGKMISPQSISVACAAVGLLGREGDLLKATLKASAIFAVISGVVIFAQALI